MAKNQKNDSKGKGKKEGEMKASTGKNPRLKRRSTPKPEYGYTEVMTALRQKQNVGQHNMTGEIIAAKGALGIRLLGGLDYLKLKHGFKFSFTTKSVFAKMVKDKEVTPFIRLRGDDD